MQHVWMEIIHGISENCIERLEDYRKAGCSKRDCFALLDGKYEAILWRFFSHAFLTKDTEIVGWYGE